MSSIETGALLHELCERLTRDQCQSLLESYGFAVYDHEEVALLRGAIRVNVLDSTIPVADVLALVEN